MFDFSKGNFKELFRSKVYDITTDKSIRHMEVKWKNELVEKLTNEYVRQTGEIPPSHSLDKLADWLLIDNSNNPDKVSDTEYPVLSHDQIKTRQRRELPNHILDKQSDSSQHKISGTKKTNLVFDPENEGNENLFKTRVRFDASDPK